MNFSSTFHGIFASFLICFFFASSPSCAFKPAIDQEGHITPRKSSPIARIQGEIQFNWIKKHRSISHNPQFTLPVERVSKRLKKAIELPDANWEFVVFNDHSPNAFALTGGKVAINTGLFKITDNDALLAAVLGHEISHATANHSEQRILSAIGTLTLGAVIYSVMDHNEIDHPELAVTAYFVASYFGNSLPLARRQEYESDRMGAIYMAKAGYDPRIAITLWEKLERYHKLKNLENKESTTSEFLRTHPLDSSRIQALKDFMPVAMRIYRQHQSTENTKIEIRGNK